MPSLRDSFSYLPPTRHCRAGLLIVSSLRDSFPAGCKRTPHPFPADCPSTLRVNKRLPTCRRAAHTRKLGAAQKTYRISSTKTRVLKNMTRLVH